jgi:hypothetical protein
MADLTFLPFCNISNDDLLQIFVSPVPLPDLNSQTNLSDVLYTHDDDLDDSEINTGPPLLTLSSQCAYSTIDQLVTWPVFQHSFTILNVNIRSINCNFTKLEILLSNFPNPPDVITISETWLKNNYSTALFTLKNYNFISVPRSQTKLGGGVAIYIRSNLNFRHIDVIKTPNLHLFDVSAIELLFNNCQNIFIINIYNPPDSDVTLFTDFIIEFIDSLHLKKQLLFLTGDFNINLLNYQSNHNVAYFLDNIMSTGLLPTITFPTRITSSTSTLIDNIFSNTISLQHHSKIIIDDISDHLPILLSLDLNKPVICNDSLHTNKRIFSSKNYLKFRDITGATDWTPLTPNNPIFDSSSPDLTYHLFATKFLIAFNTSFPPITFRSYQTRSHPSPPWFTKNLLIACRKKSRLYKKFIRSRTLANKTEFTTFRNSLKALLRKTEKLYYSQEFSKRKNNTKATWSLINNILRKKDSSNCHIAQLSSSDQTFKSHSDIANFLNSYFTSIGQTLTAKIPPTSISYKTYMPMSNPSSLTLLPTNEFEILHIINNLDDSSCHGDDDIPVSVIKSVADLIAPQLSLIINHSISKALFPSDLKLAKVIPLYKSGSRTDPSNYRPISILNSFSKIYEKIIYSRLTNFINKHNILHNNQFRFRKQHSTEQALFIITDLITKAINEHKIVCSVFLDLKKAFDTVDLHILTGKLYNYGIRGHCLDYLKSYLFGRTQYVSISNTKSNQLTITHGVPQGSVLGPLFFSYISTTYLIPWQLPVQFCLRMMPP